ncbi:hypothetical protein HY041_01370 [Candidatus Roizmanbacteria bacterium]|nr:hypothetical protein [Candidatus Roizmanbacteria bacterium]
MKYKGIIFDFNGVLFWDIALQEKAWNGMSVHMHRVENRLIFPYLLQREISEKEFKKLEEKKESAYQHMCLENKDQFVLSPGAVELLDYLTEKNISRTVATASSKGNVDFFVEYLHNFIS